MQHLQSAGSTRSGNAPAYARPRREPALARQRRFSTARIGLLQDWLLPETIVDELNRAETMVLFVLLERLGGTSPCSMNAMEEIPISTWEDITRLGARSVQGALRSLALKSLVIIEEQRIARRFSRPNRYALGPGVQKNARRREKQNLSILHSQPPVTVDRRSASGKRNVNGPAASICGYAAPPGEEQVPCPPPRRAPPAPRDDVAAAHFDSLATYALTRLAKSDPDIPTLPIDGSGILRLVDDLVGIRFPSFSRSAWMRAKDRHPRRSALAALETMLVVTARRNSSRFRPISNPSAYLAGILFNRRTGCNPEATLAGFQQAEAMRSMDRAWDRKPDMYAGLSSSAPRRMTTRELSRHPDPIVRTIAMEADGRYGIVGDIARTFAGRRRPGGRSLPPMPDIVDLAIAIHEEAACVGTDPAHILRSCMSH